MKKRIRIKDVADKAGVSTGTVDRVIHNRGRVAPEVKKRVLAVIEELGFEPNHLASALAKKKDTRIIALLPQQQNELYWEAPVKGIHSAQESLQIFGVNVETRFFDLADVNDFLVKATELLEAPPHGILLAPVFLKEGKEFLKNCKDQNIPTIIINTDIETADYLSYIGQDSFQSGVLGARLLDFGLNPGATVLFLNLTKSPTNAQHLVAKELGFRHYFKEHAAEKQLTIIKKSFKNFDQKAQLQAWLDQLMKDHPKLSGIFFTNSRAHIAIDCLEDNSSKRIKIVGFDLISPNIQYLKEDKINFLINQNPEVQGFRGITNLVNYLIKKETPELQQYLPLDIVVKENWKYYVK